MASYQGHLSLSSSLGMMYGLTGLFVYDLDWGPVFLGAGLTTLGGLLPDLDSQSGVPVRELFNLAAAAVPFLIIKRLLNADFTPEQTLVILSGLYLFIRYGLSNIFKKLTVHRGMFHSIPAMFIAGMTVFLIYESPNWHYRIFLAAGTMFGFLSHLVLDEIYSVDMNGIKLSINQFAGTALKFYSRSWKANLFCYFLFFAMVFLCLVERGVELPAIMAIP